MQPGIGPGGLQAMLAGRPAGPRLARVAQETAAATRRFASGRISALRSLKWPTNCTVST
jgi:hypothetical protein